MESLFIFLFFLLYCTRTQEKTWKILHVLLSRTKPEVEGQDFIKKGTKSSDRWIWDAEWWTALVRGESNIFIPKWNIFACGRAIIMIAARRQQDNCPGSGGGAGPGGGGGGAAARRVQHLPGGEGSQVRTRACNECYLKVCEDFTITEKAPTRAFSFHI